MECEKLLQAGKIPEGFLKEEIRCDYHIDTQMKKIWAIELEMMQQIDSIFRKYDLKYYLGFGSLLGAVRHKGFIPWDDDFDIMMPRDDYERAKKYLMELPEPYLTESNETNPNYGYSFIKVRNINTTAVSKKFVYAGMADGIFVDIFPLDNFCYEDDYKAKAEKVRQLNIDNSTILRAGHPFLDEADLERINELETRSGELNQDLLRNNLKKIDEIALRFADRDTDFYSVSVVSFCAIDKIIYNKKWFEKAEYVDYEYITLPIPSDADSILKILYGDYMQMPPVDKRVVTHNGAVFDPDHPYEEVINKLIYDNNCG